MSRLDKVASRILDLSQVKDARFKGPGFSVGEDGRARSSATLCQWILDANAAGGGTNPYPYGLLVAPGDPSDLQNPPAALQQGPFIEILVADREDPRAVRLIWNESRTEADFGFTLVAAALGMNRRDRAAMWFDVYRLQDQEGLPVLAVPVGEVQTRATRQLEPAASREPAAGPAQ